MDDWHEGIQFDITFLDNVVKKLNSSQVIPAHLVLPGTEIGIVDNTSGDVVTGYLI